MATTYEEEKKKVERPADYVAQTYAPPTPTARYAGSDSERMYNAIMQRYAEAADPQRQAEQDARIQRGRNFWTGANLFANVIANAINAHGTANGAPNMTYNDAATQKMYETWRDADKQLRADRKDAQQRYDAMALQDANMRMADQQAADKAALDAYNRNFAAQQEADKINYNNQWADYRAQEARQQKLGDEERANKEWERRNAIQAQQNERLARIRHSGSAYGIEDPYTEEEPVTAPQPQYGMPWYQPRYGEGVYGSNTQPAQLQPQGMGQWQRRPSAKQNPMQAAPVYTDEIPEKIRKPQGNAGKVKINFG